MVVIEGEGGSETERGVGVLGYRDRRGERERGLQGMGAGEGGADEGWGESRKLQAVGIERGRRWSLGRRKEEEDARVEAWSK